MSSDTHQAIAPDVILGREVKLARFINLYGCQIDDETKVGAFVEIQKNARVGKRCKISSHTFICEGVTIQDNVFIGHGVIFINDIYPRATRASGELQTEADWSVRPTLVKKGASVGSGATILANITIGENAIVGAGSTVTKDVPPDTIVAGNPARVLRRLPQSGYEDPTVVAAAGSPSVTELSAAVTRASREDEASFMAKAKHKRAASAAGKRVIS